VRSCIAFGADEPEATAAQQLQPDSDAPQPGPIGEAIIVRISKSRRCPPTRGPLAQPLEPGLLESGAWRAVTDADDEREEEEAMTTSLLSLGAVCSALEVAGVPIERAKLPSLADLRRVITLPGRLTIPAAHSAADGGRAHAVDDDVEGQAGRPDREAAGASSSIL